MFFSISKGLQDSIVNVTKGLKVEEHQDDHPLVEINNIAAVIDGVRSDRKYNDADHAHNSLSKMVSYQKAKIAELYVNGEKTKHYELNKRYDDFEPKKLSEEEEQINEISKELASKYLTAPQGKGANKYKVSADKTIYPDIKTMSKHSKSVRNALQRSSSSIYKKPSYYKEDSELDEARKLEGSYSNASGHQSKVYKLSGEHNEGDPYHVKLFKGGKHHEPADYFTNDKEDAHATAKRMVKEDNQLPEAMDNDDVKKAMSDFIAKGGKVQTLKPKKEPREKFYTSSTAHQRGRGSRSSSVMRAEENMDEQMKLHPMGLHVMPVKVQGKTMHKVHAVGSGLASGIKVGEHLTDTHLDDAVEMGAKIKRLKEQAVDSTIELHDDFTVDLPYELSYRDYLDAAQSYSEDPSEAILIADSFFKKRDESLVIENFMRSDIDSKIKSHEKAGSKVDDTKYSTKNGKPYAEYTVTDSEGRKTRYIHHGSTRRVERQ